MIYKLIEKVVVPLLIVLFAVSIGATITDLLFGHGHGLADIILTFVFGTIIYALFLPIYWIIFIREQ